MKTLKLTTLLFLITVLGYTQKSEHNSIAIANSYSNYMAVTYNQYNYIEYKNGYYEFYIGNKEDRADYQMIANVKYLSPTGSSGNTPYFYEGLLMMNDIMYNCTIETKTKLSEYTKGFATEESLYYAGKYVIKMFYYSKGHVGIKKVNFVILKG